MSAIMAERWNVHLTVNWWALAIRGIAVIFFAVAAFFFPGLTLGILVLLFGAYALVDGVFSMAAGIRSGVNRRRWWPMILEGVVGILVGLFTIFRPGLTALALVWVIAAWAIVTGVLEISAAIALRKVISREWLLVLAGVASVVFGAMLFLAPVIGAFVVLWWIGAYALIFGAILLGLAFRMRGILRARHASEHPASLAA